MYVVSLTAVSPVFVELCFSFSGEIAFIAGKVSLRKWKERIKVELAEQTSVSRQLLGCLVKLKETNIHLCT